MSINIFEGSRRILGLIAALWGFGVVVYVWNDEPTVYMTYTVLWPDQPPVRTVSEACESKDATDWKYTTTTKGTRVQLKFCFKAREAESGKMFIPYRVDRKAEKWWGADNNLFLSEVREYTERVTSDFQLPKVDSEWADSQRWSTLWKQIRDGALWLFGGLFILWILAFVIGWIVRGFMGIPMSQDQRPKSEQAKPSQG